MLSNVVENFSMYYVDVLVAGSALFMNTVGPSVLKVPCIAVVENMCYFDADGKRHYPFGEGSGSQVRGPAQM